MSDIIFKALDVELPSEYPYKAFTELRSYPESLKANIAYECRRLDTLEDYENAIDNISSDVNSFTIGEYVDEVDNHIESLTDCIRELRGTIEWILASEDNWKYASTQLALEILKS